MTHDSRPNAEPRFILLRRLVETLRRALAEFLKIPLLIVAGFVLLAVATSLLDASGGGWLAPVHDALRSLLFKNSQATSDLVAIIAASIITVTSITFSLLLLAVQQAAGALTPQVYDQFLRRRVNQIFFGGFVGLAVYTLTILATIDSPYNPVIGGAVALLLTVVALMLMIVLLYTTINQMRPAVVIEAIHNLTLRARERQRKWLGRTHQTCRLPDQAATIVRAESHGYVVRVDLDVLGKAIEGVPGEIEVKLLVPIGAYVASHDPLAEIRVASPQSVTDVVDAVEKAVHVEQQRDLDLDPAYGIEQLAIIGWTTVSTAKSNPAPGILVIRALRDLLARWSVEESDAPAVSEDVKPVAVVCEDNVVPQLLDAFEVLGVVASESMQPQTAAELIRTLAHMFGRLPAGWQSRVDDLIRRLLSTLGDHVLTAELNDALLQLSRELDQNGRGETAAEVRGAHAIMSGSVGKLGSRATRAKG